MVNKMISSALEGLFPNYCYLCGLRSYRSLPLCHDCEQGLAGNCHCCSRCALPLHQPISGGLELEPAPEPPLCGQCLQNPPAYDRVIAPLLYEEQMAFLIHRWKFHRERRLTSLLAYLWLSRRGAYPDDPDLIIPVPLHWRKLWQRGFNQSELLGAELRSQCRQLKQVKLATRWVQRHRATIAQSGLAAAQRKSNLLGAFTARRRCDNLRIAIIDDVLTTGATASVLATTLRDAGASHIEVWCMARTPEPRD